MRKEIYLFGGLEKESYAEFSKRVARLGKALVELKNLTAIKVTYTKSPPPKISIIPFKKKKVAAFSVWNSSAEALSELINAAGFIGAYKVTEAIPVKYQKRWADLESTPGICLFTLFKQREDISYDVFLDRWHNSHTPLSLKIHPLWNYNRNVASEKIAPNSAPWDGIVEEQFRTKADLLNPIKFFGNPLIMPYRMWQVYADTKRFLDYKTIEPYFATELIIRSEKNVTD